MDNIYIYLIRFPNYSVHEAVVPCSDGYTVYIDSRLTYEQQQAAYCHALTHILNGDLEKVGADVDEIEMQAHDLSA